MITAGVLGIATVLVLYGVTAGEPQPTLHDPLAVQVVDGGSSLTIALGSCSFAVTQVKVVASEVKNAVVSDQETTVWQYRPAEGEQRLFATTQTGPGVLVPFKDLSSFPSNDIFGVYVSYEQTTAPKKFSNRSQLAKSFNLRQTAAEKLAFAKMSKPTC